MLKQLENLSDQALVLQFNRNPYDQTFCGLTEFSLKPPCDSTELVHFRNRIGPEDTVNIDTTVQEKNIT
jgi:transposase, IS5 family